ncbi:MAG: cobyrinate a,c-diamide synthase [Erysipelotrichales bacterium]
MSNQRFMIAGTNSGCGKTTITCALIKALQDYGKDVVSFKCGPDYVDPMFHNKILKTKCTNLDLFLNDVETNKHLISTKTSNNEIGIIEGVMGFYDGVGGITSDASAYDLSMQTDTPVILVINGKGMSVSIIAMIKGFLDYKENNIKGVILNNVSTMLYPKLKLEIESQLNIEVLGYLPHNKKYSLEHRHLGLLMPEEVEDLESNLFALADEIKETVDLKRIVELSNTSVIEDKFTYPNNKYDLTIGIPRDKAICFYYEDNLKLLQKLGAKLEYFSLIDDKKVPNNIDALYMGGGYPELYLDDLSNNKEMLQDIKEKAINMPILAEGGSYIYLCNSYTVDNKKHQFSNILPIDIELTNKLQPFGYVYNTSMDENIFLKDLKVPAHNFHYSKEIDYLGNIKSNKPSGKRNWQGGYLKDNILASYSHYHFYGAMDLLINFLEAATKYKEENKHD